MRQQAPITRKWLNRNILGFGLTSFLSDFCHEMATAVLPQFIQAIGASAAALGFIEGFADAVSSFSKANGRVKCALRPVLRGLRSFVPQAARISPRGSNRSFLRPA